MWDIETERICQRMYREFNIQKRRLNYTLEYRDILFRKLSYGCLQACYANDEMMEIEGRCLDHEDGIAETHHARR